MIKYKFTNQRTGRFFFADIESAADKLLVHPHIMANLCHEADNEGRAMFNEYEIVPAEDLEDYRAGLL